MTASHWEPPAELSREELIKASEEVLSRPDIPLKVWEDIIRVQAVGMEWDIASEIFEPEDPAQIPVGADGKKVGMYLLHGGIGDHRYMRPVARLLGHKFGCKVVCMSYPGRCYMGNESRDWPGDTVNPDGTARTPHWLRGLEITPDQYDLIQDRSDLKVRQKRGTIFLAKAKEGTEFYYRMAGWPAAFEVGGVETCRKHFPVDEYSVYGHGRSTGGPFVNMLSQRVPNWSGIGAMENSPFAYISVMRGDRTTAPGLQWRPPFNCLSLRTWRDIAKYRGPEQGLEGAMRLPMLMEEVLEDFEKTKRFAAFKAEYMISMNNLSHLAEAATVTAKRLGLNADETEALVKHYQGYTRELSGPGVKPVPPSLLGIAEKSVDHKVSRYHEVILPAYAAINPAPRVRLTFYKAGGHMYMEPEQDLPMGCGPATCKLWLEGITNGYFVT